jgi:hypothetical protein
MINTSRNKFNSIFDGIPVQYVKYRVPRILCENLLDVSDQAPFDEILLNDTAVQQIKKNNLTIVDTTSDPLTLPGLQERYDRITEEGLQEKLCWVTDDLAAPEHFDNVIAWPEALACESYRAEKKHQKISIIDRFKPPLEAWRRSNRLSCLNRMYRPHRAYLIYWLRSRKYFSESVVTHQDKICSYTGVEMDPCSGPWAHWFDELPDWLQESLSRADLQFDDQWSNYNGENDHSYVHPAFSDTYLNIVTESVVDPGVYFSEKTFKPLAAGQLFVILGNKNSVRYLKQYGIECFFDSLDNHMYETSDCWIERANRLLALLDEIYDNIEDIYWQNIREIKHNQEWVLSDAFRGLCEKPLRDRELIW